jgi:competence protein ComEC
VKHLAWAVAATVGALLPSRIGLAAAAVAAVVALLVRWPAIGWIAVACLASGLAQRSLDGLDGVEEGHVAAAVVLVGDPAPHFDGLRVDVRWQGRRLEARARGAAADALRDRLSGEVVSVSGTVRPVEPSRPWLRARHVAGVLTVRRVDAWRPGDPLSRAANALRRTLEDGATPLGPRARALYTGIVIGDDRDQPPDLADAFRGAGLTHLLAVSGQNVAFALAVAGPVLRRLRLWPRLLATLAVIGLFGLLTRFEPSVLRASAMAAVAATAAMPGRPTSRLGLLSVAVTGLVLVDPLLVRSTGFQLSAGACLAIVVLAPPLAGRLPGSAALCEAVAVTAAAQLGVAPVLLLTFGPIPVASLPANLLCVPVAGFVMAWGLTAGVAAGALGSVAATVLHQPTRVALTWLEVVAERLARAPLGEVGPFHVVILGLALCLGFLPGRGRRIGAALAVATLAAAVLVAHAQPPRRQALAPGVVRWQADGAEVVVLGGAGGRTGLLGTPTLAALRRAGVATIDVLVIADPSVPDEVVDLVTAVHRIGTVRTMADGAGTLVVGGLLVRIAAVPGRLVVEAEPRGP